MAAKKKQNLDLYSLLKDIPKELNSDYLRQLYFALCSQKMPASEDTESVSSSLLTVILDDSSSILNKYLAIIILQKLPPISSLSEVLSTATTSQLINAFAIFFVQNIPNSDVKEVIKRLSASVKEDVLNSDEQKSVLSFMSRVVQLDFESLSKEDFKQITNMIPNWLLGIISKKKSYFPQPLNIFEMDNTEAKDIFTVLNYSQTVSPEQFLSIQVFSMLRSWLLSVRKSRDKLGKVPCPYLADSVSEELSSTVREYCLRLIEQSNKKLTSAENAEFQKACLVEAISLLDVICQADSGMVHIILPTVKRIYNELSLSIVENSESRDVIVLTTAMQFLINHSSAIMYKHDNLYPFLFCDVLDMFYRGNFATFEIIFLMKENLAQLCYNSSIMEKYFPTFLKVLAWWPVTFSNDFLTLLPAFMCKSTSMEVFHSIVDLPCTSAVLVVGNSKIEINDTKNILADAFKKPEYQPMINFMLRKSSGVGDTFDDVVTLHNLLLPLATNYRVVSCAHTSCLLMKCYFTTFLQYADESQAVLLFLSLLERCTTIYGVPNYTEGLLKIFSEGILQLFVKHPVTVLHCQKKIAQFLNHFSKNYFVSEQFFIHLLWAVGEYVSVEYSNLCRPEIITFFYHNIEPTVYEMISFLTNNSNDLFLKLICVSVSSLAKLAARSQDLVPQAQLCLGKVHHKLMTLRNDHKICWKIVGERILELLMILKTPNVASVVLSPSKDLETGKLHKDATSLPFALRAVTALLSTDEKKSENIDAY